MPSPGPAVLPTLCHVHTFPPAEGRGALEGSSLSMRSGPNITLLLVTYTISKKGTLDGAVMEPFYHLWVIIVFLRHVRVVFPTLHLGLR